MDKLVQLCLSFLCVTTPIILILLSGGVYTIAMGIVNIPGIGRREKLTGKEWTTVSDLARKASELLAAVISLVGTLFGLLGFFLPWVSVNIGAAITLVDLGGLSGTLSGIALAFQPIVIGVGLLSTEFEGATGVGMGLILISVLVSLIPFALLVLAAIGIGMISIPLGLINIPIKRLAPGMLIMSVLSLCLTCAFFGGIQATVGGIKVGGSEGIFGSSMSIGAEVAYGFWITVGGLVLALIGAIAANTLPGALSSWATNLSDLESSPELEGSPEKEEDIPEQSA